MEKIRVKEKQLKSQKKYRVVSILLLIYALFSLLTFSFAQQSKIDSLLLLLIKDKEACPEPCLGDTNKVNHLNALAIQLYSSNPDTSALLSTQALQLSEKQNWKKGIASSCMWLGWCKSLQGDYPKALDYDFKALRIAEEIKDKKISSSALGAIGSVYWNQGDYPKALDYYLKALKMKEELGDKNGIAIALGSIGSLYIDTKKYSEAEKYLLDALKLDKEIGAMNSERQYEELITDLYTKTNRYQLALEHYKKAMALKDTLFSEEKNKEITRKEMNYEFEKKEAAAKAEADKQAAVAEAESKKQKIVIWSVIAVLLLVAVFAGFIFRALRITQKQKQLIEQQKKIVEEKQNEILASIRYAKRIQDAILPTEKYIDKTLKRLMKK